MDDFDVNFEQVLEQLRGDFLADIPEWMDRIDDTAMNGVDRGKEPILSLYREAHNLKGTAGSYGFRTVSLIAHRLEDYLQELSELEERHVTAIGVFVDRMRGIFEADHEPETEETGRILRDLPRARLADLDTAVASDIEILLVTPSRSVARILQHELRAYGYQVTRVETAWQAVEMAVCVCPDMVITAAVLDSMSGIDLVLGLRAMGPTRQIPVAVLTSFSEDHEEIQRLPTGTSVIRLGKDLSGELADVISATGLA